MVSPLTATLKPKKLPPSEAVSFFTSPQLSAPPAFRSYTYAAPELSQGAPTTAMSPLTATLKPNLSKGSVWEEGSFLISLRSTASALFVSGLRPAGPTSTPAATRNSSANMTPRIIEGTCGEQHMSAASFPALVRGTNVTASRFGEKRAARLGTLLAAYMACQARAPTRRYGRTAGSRLAFGELGSCSATAGQPARRCTAPSKLTAGRPYTHL